MDRPLIEHKLESLRRCLERVRDKCPPTAAALSQDLDAQDILSLNLTRAVQLCVDIATHILADTAAAAIDNLGRMERLGLIVSADEWLQRRGLRHRLVHEYFDRPEELAPALERACRFTERMHNDYGSIRVYALKRLGVGNQP